jgi:primase-polymerase (primpol)-like protein
LAKASTVGAGLGFVLGDGVGCIDLDHCLVNGVPTDAATEVLAAYPGNYVEVSPSGDGLHIWGSAEPEPGTRRVEDGLSVERYSTGRYITVTGSVFRAGTLRPL